MPAYKDSKTGTWFVKFYCKDWTGENKQIKKRGFATKREALDYERNYKIRQENNLDMTFGEFWKLYTEDVKNYVKLNTWLTKEHIVDTKILPYFKNLKMNEITPGDVRKWQNEMVAFRYENGKRRYKSDRKDHKVSVKLSEKDMDILKAALNRTGMTASAYIRELIRTGGNIDTSYPEDRAKAIRIIAGVANNINQTVKLGNSQGRLYYSDIDKLQNSLDDVKKTFGEVLEVWRLQRS